MQRLSNSKARLHVGDFTQRFSPQHSFIRRPLASSRADGIKITYAHTSDPVHENGKFVPSVDPPTPTTLPTTTTGASASFLSNLSPTAIPATAAIEPDYLPPPVNYQNLVRIGQVKGMKPPGRIFLLGCQAGAFLSFACILMASVGSNIPGILASNPGLHKLICGLIFPCGLLMVTLNGTELYTGNTATITMAVLEGKLNFGQLVKNWFWSYLGNATGCIALVCLVMASGALNGNTLLPALAVSKTSIPFFDAVLKSLLANWLVCIAVTQGASSSSLVGKVFALWWPIAAFVTIGLEHSIANIFIIPAGMALGANVTVADFLMKNLLPVTIGNTIAGVFFVAILNSLLYGSLGKDSIFQ